MDNRLHSCFGALQNNGEQEAAQAIAEEAKPHFDETVGTEQEGFAETAATESQRLNNHRNP